MIPAIITVAINGTARCLYTEAIDLRSIGSLELRRASVIEFNNSTQMWEVRDLNGQTLHSHPSRQACLAWEAQQLKQI